MKNKALSTVLRVLAIIITFILCLASIFMVVVSLTFADHGFYERNISEENVKLAVSTRTLDYFNKKSNQTTIPIEVFFEGYNDEILNELIDLRAEDTANFIIDGTPYPKSYADEKCDFRTHLVAFADEFSAEYTVSDADLLYEEIDDVAEGSVLSVDSMTNPLNLSILEKFGFLSKVRAFLGSSKLITVNLVLFAAVLAAVLWVSLYGKQKRRGAYTALGTLWLSSAVVYSVALVFKSIKMTSRLPIERGTPLHSAVFNLVKNFQDTFVSVSGGIFFVLLTALVIASWLYAEPKKKSEPAEAESAEPANNEVDNV